MGCSGLEKLKMGKLGMGFLVSECQHTQIAMQRCIRPPIPLPVSWAYPLHYCSCPCEGVQCVA
jgi:hypothetical protein